MHDFVKAYTGLFLGSIREEGVSTRWVFLACLILSDANGDFTATEDAIAAFANVPLGETREALVRLQAPDPQSTTPDEEGRRIVLTGVNKWCVVNKRLYWERTRSEERREYLRAKKRESRIRGRGESTPVDNCQQVNRKRKEDEIRESPQPPHEGPRSTGGRPQARRADTPTRKGGGLRPRLDKRDAGLAPRGEEFGIAEKRALLAEQAESLRATEGSDRA